MPIDLHNNGHLMLRRLLAPLLVLVSFSLHAAVEVSPPDIGHPPIPVAGRIASNGDGFLALVNRFDSERSSVLVALDRRGERINDVGRTASWGFGPEGTAYLTRLRSHYLMSWIDEDRRSRLSEVSPGGEILADWPAEGVPVAPEGRPYELHSTTDGESVLVVDRIGRVAWLLTSEGELLREIDPPGWTMTFTGIAGGFIRATGVAEGVAVDILPSNGAPPAPPTVLQTSGLVHPPVAAAMIGDRVLLAWVQQGTYPNETFVAVVSPSGVIRPPTPLQALRTGYAEVLALVAAGDTAVLVVRQARVQEQALPVIALRLDADASPVGDPFALFQKAGGVHGGFATNGERIVVHKTQPAPPGAVSVALSFTPDQPNDLRRVITSVTHVSQISPRVAGDGVESLVVWQEETAAGDAIKARRLTPAAGPLGETITVVTTGRRLDEHTVAAGGGIYLIVWQDGPEVYGVRMSMSGEVLDRVPLLIARDVDWRVRLAAASDGSNFVVLVPPRAVAVSAAGVVSPAREVVPLSPTRSRRSGSRERVIRLASLADVAWDGRSYVFPYVLYTRSEWRLGPQHAELRIARVAADGTPQTDTVLLLPVPATYSPNPKIASSGSGRSLVTFLGPANTMMGIHLAGDAPTVGSPFVIEESMGLAGKPPLPTAKPRFDGRDYVMGKRGHEYHVLLRVAPGSTEVRRLFARSSRRLEVPQLPVEVAVSSDGTAALIAQELRAHGTDAATWRVMAYLHHEMTPQHRHRSVGH